MDKLKEFVDNLERGDIVNMVLESDLYSYQKAEVFTKLSKLRDEINAMYAYHWTHSEETKAV